MQPATYNFTISKEGPKILCDFIAAHTGYSKTRVKKALNCGAVWVKRGKGKRKRIRRAKTLLHVGDRVFFYYDENILNITPIQAHCVKDFGRYSIWCKPAGLTTQGSRFGDHCSLSRQLEKQYASKRRVLLVHRLDREAVGLVLIAHDRTAASKFSSLFRRRHIQKLYRIYVSGNLNLQSSIGRIEFPLDGLQASTSYRIVSHDPDLNQSIVTVELHSGRHHQIRRHFDMLGFPVIGDPRYGTQNKNRTGMHLVAYALTFQCPFGNRSVHVQIDPDEFLP